MVVAPCSWAVDVTRRTGLYGCYPYKDDYVTKTKLRTFFTDWPFLPFPHTFTNSDFFQDRADQFVPGVSSDWHDHKLKKGPPANFLPFHLWFGSLDQWAGNTSADQPKARVDGQGLCIECAWCAIMDETNVSDFSFIQQEDGSIILDETCVEP